MTRDTPTVINAAPPPKSNKTVPDFKDLNKKVQKLLTMLTYKRPGGSQTEDAFVRRFITPTGAKRDEWHNHWLTIPGNPDLLFSSHIDTVHTTDGIQVVYYDADMFASVEHKECLGADDTVGVWLMLEMIAAKIPGTYLFHADEESGGKGSNAIALHRPEWINQHKYAIAFDRKGTDEIIVHQWAGRTASDEFAASLAGILHPLAYKLSDKGSFTDTANYAHLIPECTNLSVGYYRQHQKTETLDMAHAMALRDALCAADWSRLVCSRIAAKPASASSKWSRGASYWSKEAQKWVSKAEKNDNLSKPLLGCDENWPSAPLLKLVMEHPFMVATWLADNGFTPEEIEAHWDALVYEARTH